MVAHRGVHQGIPENSLPAFRKAIELGCDFVEIDLRTTKDQHLVVIHNSTIDAYIPGETGRVAQMTLSELRALDIGKKWGPRWNNTRIPTFEETLQLCKGKIGIYLDLKSASIEQTVTLIQKYEMEDSVHWYGSIPKLAQLQQQSSQSLVMPDPHHESFLPFVLDYFHPQVIASRFDALSPSFLKQSHEAKAIVIADESTADPMSWKKWIDLGLDGIQTDDPEKLIRFLKDQNQ